MKTLTKLKTVSKAIAVGALMTVATGCSKDPAPDGMMRDVIIETGYVECITPSDACDGVVQCIEANDAEICVQAPVDECVDALTCECVGAWVCGDLPCADIDGGFSCGDDPEPPPPENCFRLAPPALDFGMVLVGDVTALTVLLIADCPASLDQITLVEDTDQAFLIGAVEGADGELAAGDIVEISVAVSGMEAVGRVTGTLEVNGDPALRVALSADLVRPIGGNCLMAMPALVDFGDVPVGTTARRTIEIEVNCDGALESDLTQNTPETGEFVLVTPIDGAVQAGEGFTATVDLTPTAIGSVRGELNLGGVGAPLGLRLVANATPGTPDCRDEGVGCLGGLACNAAGQCVNLTQFVIEFEPDAPEMYLQLWPIGDPPYLLIESADHEFTAFNPGSIFEPCDACDAAPDCAERPETVGAVSQMGALVWDRTWWLTDTPDGDDCARPQPVSAGLYVAILCGAREADVQGEFSEDGRAPGTINQSFCLPAVQFDPALGGDVVLTVPAL